MKKISALLLIIVVFAGALSACSEKSLSEFVFIEGGEFKSAGSSYYGSDITVSDFYIGRYLVTQKQWKEVMGDNPSKFEGENLPVENVSWYDSIEYCNKRSQMEGLELYYNIDRENSDPENDNDLDDIKWTVTVNEGAGGYRLPTEVEWEYAAGGGQKSRNYIYAGSNEINDAAWYFRNAGDKFLTGEWSWDAISNNNSQTKPVGSKKPNEMGLYDMSGNVREWCWDVFYDKIVYEFGFARVWKGGGWIGNEPPCRISFRGYLDANGYGPDQGLRVCAAKLPEHAV